MSSGDHPHDPPAHPTSLRALGRRHTRQREAIWNVILADPSEHLSADDIAGRVREELPHVNASTVYRTLDLLASEGLLLRTDLGGERAYYEPAHEHPHHHLVCERCGSVTHVHDELLGDLAARLKDSAGFAVGKRELSIFGICADCAEETPRRDSKP